MVTTLLELVAGLAGGAASGVAVFGGLAATLRRLPHSRHPATLVAGSLGLRLVMVAAVLTGLARLGGMPLLAGVVALLAVRTVLLRRPLAAPTRRPGGPPASSDGARRWN